MCYGRSTGTVSVSENFASHLSAIIPPILRTYLLPGVDTVGAFEATVPKDILPPPPTHHTQKIGPVHMNCFKENETKSISVNSSDSEVCYISIFGHIATFYLSNEWRNNKTYLSWHRFPVVGLKGMVQHGFTLCSSHFWIFGCVGCRWLAFSLSWFVRCHLTKLRLKVCPRSKRLV